MIRSTDRARRRRCRVLVLEDSVEFRQVLVEFLAGEGFEVATCNSYASLREAVGAAPNSIVLADFWGTSHLELSATDRAEIRELGRRAPTILLTGRAWAVSVSAADLSVVCILAKPSTLEEIDAQLQRCLSFIQSELD